MKITVDHLFTFKSGITCNRLTCKTEFGGRGGSKVIFDHNIYAREPLDTRKFKKLMAENGFEGLEGLFCDGDCIREDSEAFTKMNNFLVDFSNKLDDEQNTHPFAWDIEFIKQLKKTENGGIYAFYVVLEKGTLAAKIPYYCYADDFKEYDQIIDFVNGKMVSLYGESLAKKIISTRVEDLIGKKDDFNAIVKILTEDSKKNNAQY